MIRNMRRLLSTFALEKAMLDRSKLLSARRRFIPRLERLEERACPSISFGAGSVLNLNRQIDTHNYAAQIVDNQNTPTVAIDPANTNNLFMAALSWHGGYSYPVGSASVPPVGFFANYSTGGKHVDAALHEQQPDS